MIEKVNSIVRKWLKVFFSDSFFFSNILFPANVLVFYILSFLFLYSRVFHIWQGVSYNFIVKSGRWVPFLAAGIFLFFMFIVIIRKEEKLTFNNSREKIQSKDFLLLLLPLTPVIQYLINNQRILSLIDAIWVIGFFLGLSTIFIFVIPAIFGKISSIHILIPLGLSFVSSMTYMALLTQSNNWYDTGSFTVQWLLLSAVFLVTWIFYSFDGKSLLRLIVVIFFASNTALQIADSIDLERVNSSAVEENKLLELVSSRQLTNSPNVYLLVYDAYVANETLLGYGIDNGTQEEFLVNSGFTLYPATYSVGDTTLGTMSRVLNASTDFLGSQRRAVSGDGIVQNLFKSKGYQTIGLFPFDYFFREDKPSWDYLVPEYKTPPAELLLTAILMGEFRFDLGFDALSSEQFVSTSHDIFRAASEDPLFTYKHSLLPRHSQNSGICRPNETELFENRLAEANTEMQQDVNIILKNDPGAIIIVAGDHGPYLTKNCVRYVDFDVSELTRLEIQDRFGTFLAIRWPTNDFENYDDITVIQDVFPSIFAYLFSDADILEAKIASATISEKITVENGIILVGVDAGEPLFLSDQ